MLTLDIFFRFIYDDITLPLLLFFFSHDADDAFADTC